MATPGQGVRGVECHASRKRFYVQPKTVPNRAPLTSGAVRVGDDVLVPRDCVRVDLRHDERAVRIHAKDAAVVDNDAASRRSLWCPHRTKVATGRKERDVDVIKRIITYRLAVQRLATKLNRRALLALHGRIGDSLRQLGGHWVGDCEVWVLAVLSVGLELGAPDGQTREGFPWGSCAPQASCASRCQQRQSRRQHTPLGCAGCVSCSYSGARWRVHCWREP